MKMLNKKTEGFEGLTLLCNGNGEAFYLSNNEIVDFELRELKEIEKGVFTIGEGYIIVSKEAFNNLSLKVAPENRSKNSPVYEQTIESYGLYNYLMGSESIEEIVIYIGGDKLRIVCIYNPFKINSYTTDVSNCPSISLNKENDLIINLGRLSEYSKRVDNDYLSIIENLNKVMDKNPKHVLKITNVTFENYYDEGFQHGIIGFDCKELESLDKIYLRISSIEELNINTNFTEGGKELDLRVSQYESGECLLKIGEMLTLLCQKIELDV